MFVTIRPEVIGTDKIMNESEAEHEMEIGTPQTEKVCVCNWSGKCYCPFKISALRCASYSNYSLGH